jgi:hypothetical protein
MKGRRVKLIILAVVLLVASPRLFAEDPAEVNRNALYRTLINLAHRAQRFYYASVIENGGQGSFSSITLQHITSTPKNAYGSFVLAAPSATSVTLTGRGVEIGHDGITLVEIQAVVYGDSVTIIAVN